MNIKRAKEEIKDTAAAYLLKDDCGEYVIPSIRQRPVLLIGRREWEKPRLWSRLPENAVWVWLPIPLLTIQGRAPWVFRLLNIRFTEERNMR